MRLSASGGVSFWFPMSFVALFRDFSQRSGKASKCSLASSCVAQEKEIPQTQSSKVKVTNPALKRHWSGPCPAPKRPKAATVAKLVASTTPEHAKKPTVARLVATGAPELGSVDISDELHCKNCPRSRSRCARCVYAKKKGSVAPVVSMVSGCSEEVELVLVAWLHRLSQSFLRSRQG